jgi:signal transduction histidine kinase
MFEFISRKWQSLVFRLLFYFLLCLLALTIVIAISFSQRIKPQVQQQILPNVAKYLDYVIQDIGFPPDLAVAQRLADELPFEIRIEGQGIDWASSRQVRPLSKYHFEAAPAPYEGVFFSHHRRQEMVLIRQNELEYLFLVSDGFRRGSELRHWLLFVSLGGILLLLYVGIQRLFRPIGVISEQVRQIGEGDLQQTTAVVGKGELALLAAGINRMSQQISSMLESKSAMLLAISHELRSPLTRIRVNLELLDHSDVREKLIDDCREMEALLAAILESEKLGSGHAPLALSHCDLMSLVAELIASHPERERIRSNLTPVFTAVDELRIKLLLKNLIDNACQYSRNAHDPVEVSLQTDANCAILTVSDHGEGIAAEDLPRLHEAFYRPDSARQRNTGGYGLGLYLCHLIVNAHKGDLRIDSEPGMGTRVIIRLPLDNT